MTKSELIQMYLDFKKTNNRTPSKKEFITFSGVTKRYLEQLYGDNPFSKFQEECGDSSNKLTMIRTPIDQIMYQFGKLALELNKLPTQGNWENKRFKPTISGLAKPPHLIKWSDLPLIFKEWAISHGSAEFSKVLILIEKLQNKRKETSLKVDKDFEKLISDVRSWSPSRRRNSEEVYKVELRKHLEILGYFVNEEFGESKFDLLINKMYPIEIKKDPNLSEYDRLFGQIARHLQHQSHLIALIFDVPAEDKFSNFVSLVEKFLNSDEKQIEVMKK